jgi:hypothetical protein
MTAPGEDGFMEIGEQPPLALDSVLHFLADLPDEAVDELVQLARAERRWTEIRQRLASRLKVGKKQTAERR